ncbi:MAG TPA: DUF4249 domain-containing protein [Bacteroidales bacterium]|nr:DUF4249 domain-containing protein [Bacteroidales bacterium]
MKKFRLLILFAFILIPLGCVTQFMPEIEENRELLVVEGLVTDQPETNTIRLTRSLPLDKKANTKPVLGYTVRILDDLGNSWTLKETGNGYYITDSLHFRGEIGRLYTLKINSNGGGPYDHSYESQPMEMKPVPTIDKLFFERELIDAGNEERPPREGCMIYLDAKEKGEGCSFFRWDYIETWEIRLPYDVPNRICWSTNKSTSILIKNTTLLSENSISRYPVNFLSNETDRLAYKYSILVIQYSINEQEFDYWDKMRKIAEQTGSLYDIIPASIQGNIYCLDAPSEKVLGYFSVSAKTTRRLFIEDKFSGQVDIYRDCANGSIPAGQPITGLGKYVWVILDGSFETPPIKVITYNKACADCTMRGTKIRPDFWNDDIDKQ